MSTKDTQKITSAPGEYCASATIAKTMENSLTYQLRGENPWACTKGYTTTSPGCQRLPLGFHRLFGAVKLKLTNAQRLIAERRIPNNNNNNTHTPQ